MRKICLYLIYLLLPLAGHAQLSEEERMRPRQVLYINPADDKMNYIPYDTGDMPIKRVRLTVHIFGKSDGSGNFRDIPAHRNFMDAIWNHVNWHFREPEPFHPLGPKQEYVFIPDTRIRFVVDTVLFHQDDEAWNFRKYSCYYDSNKKDSVYSESKAYRRAEQLHSAYVKGDAALPVRNKDSSIHVFFVEIEKYQNRGMAQSLFSKKWLFFIGPWHFYAKDSATRPNHWDPGMVLAHELGHSLGLHHPYDGGECADLPFTPPGKTNDIVDTWPNEGRAFTPQQIGLMHLALSGKRGDVGDALIRDWHTYDAAATTYIHAGDTVHWLRLRYLRGDLVVRNGAVLAVHSDVELPPGAKIKINPGGALILEHAEIKNAQGSQWQGVELVRRRRFLFFGQKNEGVLELRNGGKFTGNINEIERVKL